MAHLYASDGDTIQIQGREFHLLNTGGTFSLHEMRRDMCVGCYENEVDEKGDFCPTCVRNALTHIRVLQALDTAGHCDNALGRTLRHLDEDDDTMRKAGISHVDSESAAIDMFIAEDEDVVRDMITEHVNRVVITPVLDAR